MHPTEPWVLAAMYDGTAKIWNYETEVIVKSFEVSNEPIRACKFVARKNWIILGGDDFNIRVFNYNTSEKVHQFEAHPDYIRAIDVHPSQPYLLTSSDDMTIKLWNWDLNWKNVQTFEGHSHYIMYVAFNPKDPNTFASACLDQSVKVWSLGSSIPNITLNTQTEKGANYVQYYPRSDKPYLIAASDDQSVRVWDYQTKSCVATMTDHSHNVSFAIFHPELPVIVSGSEDNTVKIWNASTYRLEQTLNYGFERAWCVSCKPNSNLISIGFDTGVVVLQLGKEEPAVSMDGNGKLIWSKQSEIFSSVAKRGTSLDGEFLALSQKELGSVEVYPTQLIHSPNGRFVAVSGDGEYIIYTALAWRNKSFGSGVEVCWSADSNEYVVRDASGGLRAFKNFKERGAGHFNVNFNATQIFGGALLGVKGDDEFVAFYDWESGKLVRRIDVEASQIVWNESGELVAVISDESFYILRFDRNAFEEGMFSGAYDEDEGVEVAFDVEHEIAEGVRTGKWAGDSFIYTTTSNRLNYLVGSHSYTISHFDHQMYFLGYLPRDDAVYLCDKDINVTSYQLSLAVVEYQTVVLRGDMEYAAELLEKVPEGELTKMARFLENQGYGDIALEVTRDPDHKFELALQQDKLDIAKGIVEGLPKEESTSAAQKWRALGDSALEHWDVDLAEKCFEHAGDLDSLLLIYTSTGEKNKLGALAARAVESGRNNVAFNAQWYAGDVDACVNLLQQGNRSAEASLLALTYGGDVVNSVQKWKEELTKSGHTKIAALISSPDTEPDAFPENVGQKAPKTQQDHLTSNDLIDMTGEPEPTVAPAEVSAEEPAHEEVAEDAVEDVQEDAQEEQEAAEDEE